MDKDKYIGKQWSYNSSKKTRYGTEIETEIFFIFDIINYGPSKFSKDGKDLYSMLAIKIKYDSNGGTRYSITNPNMTYALYYEGFFKDLRRYGKNDMGRDCIKYLFDKGPEKWSKRYSGHKNLIGIRI